MRRPGDWTGRLDSIVGSDPISDESFVKSWGTLPDEPLTLCGTRRFVRECRASLSTGRHRGQAVGQADGATSARAWAGRDDGRGRAFRALRSIRARRSEASREGMQIIQVAADGLADWSTTADGRLHLMFDGSTAAPQPAAAARGLDPGERGSASGSARVSIESAFRGSIGRESRPLRDFW